MNLESALNDAQREAVTYCDGPELVIAGAGSGKTRVLTYKIAYLLQHGYKPWNILALTFTNKAAREMKERIGHLVGEDLAHNLYMGTFHSIFARILRIEAQAIGFNGNFTIYDETDSRSLLKSIVKEMDLDDKLYKPATVKNIISKAKDRLINYRQYAADEQLRLRDEQMKLPKIGEIYTAYQSRLTQANAMDFDDLLLNTYMLFDARPEIKDKYAHRFGYILVDEYQDTNYTQQCILLQLASEHQRLCVVGDDNQSIYSFRGANIDNILGFQNIFRDAKLVKLERNYRSTQNIVAAANSLIQNNRRQIKKHVYSEESEGEKVKYRRVKNGIEEAVAVCREIRRLKREENSEWSDFAVLYRTNSQSRAFEEQMRRPGYEIPYRIYGGLSFYQRKEVKDVIAYLRLVANPDDEEAFKRIINYPARGIGNTTMMKIVAAAQASRQSLWQVICNPMEYGLNVSKGTLQKLFAFRDMMATFINKADTLDVLSLTQQLLSASGIKQDLYSGSDPDDVARQENLQELISGIGEFTGQQRQSGNDDRVYVTDYLQEVSLMTDLDSDNGDEHKVSLMTIHAAKGLEFTTVFVVGLEEGLFPSIMSNSQREIEEERRLLYVAMTRAERHCYLSSAEQRMRYGKTETNIESRFVKNIDKEWIDREDNTIGSLDIDDHTASFGGYDPDYEPNKPYMGYGGWQRDSVRYNSRMQNSRPVASQFQADVKPKITSPRKAETAVNPFSDRALKKLLSEGGNYKRIVRAETNGGRRAPSSPLPFNIGQRVEHKTFGKGTVERIEGEGADAKAIIVFDKVGKKTLLLRYAVLNKI